MSDKVTPESEALAKEHGLVVQPAPVSNDAPSVHDIVADGFKRIDHIAGTRVREDILKRKEFGLAKYGTILQPGNGRDSIADAYDETLDQLVYLKTRIEEHLAETHTVPWWLVKAERKSTEIALLLATHIRARELDEGAGNAN